MNRAIAEGVLSAAIEELLTESGHLGRSVIDPGQVSAVVPTRGDVDMSAIVESLEDAGYGEIIVAGPELYGDQGVYKRFLGIRDAKFPVVYTQDDDIVFRQHADLLALYKPGVLVSAYPQPWNIPWISTGAVFDRELPETAFGRYFARYEMDWFFTHQACDGVFGLLTDSVEVHAMPYEELPWATAAGRIHTTDGWYDRDRPQISDRCNAIK